jgi:hypothetical protein
MAPSYKFAIIRAKPDGARGETVNVGLVVFASGKLDIRLPELRKLKHLSGHAWDGVADTYATHLGTVSAKYSDLDHFISSFDSVSEVFLFSPTGTFVSETNDQYEDRIKGILNHFVSKPALSRKEKQQKINAEISKLLKSRGMFSRDTDDINNHKVISKFIVSQEKDIVADFAYKNGSLRVVSTLDLRSATTAHSRACEKGATLYFAKERFGHDAVSPMGVYAANPLEIDSHKGEIEILKSFADGNIFNWSDAQERMNFIQALY